MQPQENIHTSGSGNQDSLACSQCGAPMPSGMRFCRSCGNRLGEGPAEYTETVRFPGSTAKRPVNATTPFYPGVNTPLTKRGVGACRRRLGFTGMTWMWISLGLFFAVGGGVSALLKAPHVSRPRVAISVNRSFFGVNSFDTTDGGATFNVVEPPGGPADKAGLVGGDIITSFDGHQITEANQIMDLLTQVPSGKIVDVSYLRDGVAHTTQLTPVSTEEFDRLKREFDNRPEGKGMFGFERDKMKRISIPETKTFGVRIDQIITNSPADLFGIKEGDIVTDFDKVPIRTPEEFFSRVRRAIPYTTVNIALLRDGQRFVLPVKMGKGRN
jgi:membrane-associated protease RseP (regulator of RpoE activity)